MPTKPAPKSEANVKALTDKLVEELRASGADLSKLTQQVTPDPNPDPALAPASPVEPPAAVPTAAPPPKKALHLPHLSLPKFKPSPPPAAAPAESPAEVVAPEVQQLTNEALLEMVDKRLTALNSSDIITLRLNKKELLAIAGIVLAIIWLQPVIHSINVSSFSLSQFSKSIPSPSPAAAASPIPSPSPLTVRLRLGSDSLESAAAVKSLLAPLHPAVIDVIHDTQLNPRQVLIVTRQDQPALREQLTALLAKDYLVSSESAVLTEDSDFSATILIGTNAKLKK